MELFAKQEWGSVVLLTVLVLMNLSAIQDVAAGSLVDERMDVNVFVICLDGVNASCVENMSRVFEGVLLASKVDRIRYWTGEWEYEGMTPRRVMGEIPINVSVTAIIDWTAYRILVEYANNVIIMNAHGEILPVPNTHGREEWIDRIADAMLNRNVTWVHMAGYPFRYCWHKKTGEEAWGEEGFKQLMTNMGKSNVTCEPRPVTSGPFRLNPTSEQDILIDWCEFHHAFWVGWGYTLKNWEFKNHLVMPPIYGTYSGMGPLPAAVVKFAKENQSAHHNFGFFVHFGVGQTYEYDGEKITDRDFYGAYAAAAVAIRAHVMKAKSLEAIYYAEAAIIKARLEGRIKGLDKAVNLLMEAKEAYFSNSYDEALLKTYQAKKAVVKAVNPSFIESYGYFWGALGIATAILGGLAIRWRNNRHKNSHVSRKENERT